MLLLSIHPRHVDAILSGEKKVELRRRKPSVENGPGLIYSTTPKMELAATFDVEAVTRTSLSLLWPMVRDVACVTRKEFDAYFQGLESGVVIHLANVRSLQAPISLSSLRIHWPGFQPPQGFRYLDEAEVLRVMKCEHAFPAKRVA